MKSKKNWDKNWTIDLNNNQLKHTNGIIFTLGIESYIPNGINLTEEEWMELRRQVLTLWSKNAYPKTTTILSEEYKVLNDKS
jgi:hypothetical protein